MSKAFPTRTPPRRWASRSGLSCPASTGRASSFKNRCMTMRRNQVSSAAWTLGVIYADYRSHPAENAMLNVFVWEASIAMLGLQVLALWGLYTRQHWGRAMATIASGFWIFTLIGIPFAVLVWWALHR